MSPEEANERLQKIMYDEQPGDLNAWWKEPNQFFMNEPPMVMWMINQKKVEDWIMLFSEVKKSD